MFTAGELRKNPTLHEKQLWEYLRAHRLMGYKFRRQHQIGRAIVDFVCMKEKLIVELDGGIHDNRKLYDNRRDAWLRSKGFQVLRFRNEEWETTPEKVILKIKAVLKSARFPSGS